MNNKNTYILILFLFLTACGFKIVNQSVKANFEIVDIISSGNTKINFKIKNKLIGQSKSSKSNKLLIELYSETKKAVKEKNISNEVTKYNLTFNVTVKFKELTNNKDHEFKLSKTGEILVANEYSQTKTNERKLIDIYADILSSEILDIIIKKIDDI